MRILYLCHRVPFPPNKGEKIRAFHQVRHLSQSHEIHLLSLVDQPEDQEYAAPLRKYCKRVELFRVWRPGAFLRCSWRAVQPRPLTLSFFESRELRDRVAELGRTESFDAVVACSSSMAPYTEPLPPMPRVLDLGDVDSAKWGQYASFAGFPWNRIYRLEARRLQAYERSLSSADRLVLVTENEVSLLRSFAPKAKAVSIPNGVDRGHFRRLNLPRSENPTVVFTGQMDYFPNVDGVVRFARNVFPRLRSRMPNLEFLVVGRSPAASVRALESIPGVTVTGTVGDVRPFLARSWVFVAPLRIAQGIQNKVLEAMASDLPVVCTPRILQGLSDGDFQDGRDLLVASTDEEWEEKLSGLLGEPEAGQQLVRAARMKLESVYSWETNLQRFEADLEELVRRYGRPRAVSRSRPGKAVSQPALGGA